MPLPEDIDGLSPAELKLLVVKLLEEVADLRRTVAAQRDEIARLKGGPGRPNIKPNSKPSGIFGAHRPLGTVISADPGRLPSSFPVTSLKSSKLSEKVL